METEKLLLNLGCGSNFHPHWRNLDLVPQAQEVEQANLAQGIPCESNAADVVYHSHVLEHLTRSDAKAFVAECFRVLKPGGILRIAVPDLEQIAGYYLKSLRQAWEEPNSVHLANHQWMQLELLDQLLRKESGGDMGKYMVSPSIPNREFLDSRLGHEVANAEAQSSREEKKPGFLQRLKSRLKRKVLRLCFGKDTLRELDIAAFRQSGEIHQWMYDRVSLRKLLNEQGFENFTVCEHEQSSIEDFASYELDFKDGKALKPDSLFVEATKPQSAGQRVAA